MGWWCPSRVVDMATLSIKQGKASSFLCQVPLKSCLDLLRDIPNSHPPVVPVVFSKEIRVEIFSRSETGYFYRLRVWAGRGEIILRGSLEFIDDQTTKVEIDDRRVLPDLFYVIVGAFALLVLIVIGWRDIVGLMCVCLLCAIFALARSGLYRTKQTLISTVLFTLPPA